VFAPLRIGDFRLLWAGMTVSLLGDGLYVVAVAWQAYQISNSPYALAVTGVAWTLPTVLVLPFSGALSDRVGRRPLMILADLLRAAAVGGIALLAALGTIEVWHLVALSAVFGVGEALFNPSFVALVPEIVPEPQLVQANSLDQAMRPLAMQFLGPALGGAIVASAGTATAFALDGASFLFSAAMILLIRARPAIRHDPRESLMSEIGEGVAYVRRQVWLWGTLLAFSITVLVFWGPIEVLVPFVIKNDLGGGAGGFGLVLAAGGAGAIVAAVVTSLVGLPRQRLTLCFLSFIVAGFGTAFYGVATALWQMAVIAAVAGACFAVGLVAWGTIMQTQVPAALLGRVSSLDWMVSISLLPVSFALVGPVSGLLGARTTLIAAGLGAGSILMVALVLLPGLRDIDRAEPSRPAVS
jgi:DHA3 family tetracycline resistance protein-like MFS transporter